MPMGASVPAVSLPQDYFFILNPFIPLHLVFFPWLLGCGCLGVAPQAPQFFVSQHPPVNFLCLIKP